MDRSSLDEKRLDACSSDPTKALLLPPSNVEIKRPGSEWPRAIATGRVVLAEDDGVKSAELCVGADLDLRKRKAYSGLSAT